MNKSLNKNIKLLILMFASIFFLSSCNTFSNIETIMQPPKLSAEQSDLQNALEEHIGTNVTLKYPKSGDNRTAFVECNIDMDDDNEVIAFHQANVSGSQVIINVLDKNEGQWEWICDSSNTIEDEFSRTEIYSVAFYDINNDGKNEIVAGWNQSTSTNKCMTVYNYEDNQLKHLFSIQYTEGIIADLDNDGQSEVFITLLNSAENTGEALVYKWNGSQANVIGETKIDGKVTGYAALKTGYLYDSDKLAVYIDGYKSANEMITEVIYFNKEGMLVNPFFIESEGLTKATYRANTLLVQDINLDDYFDIPSSVELPGYEEKIIAEKMWLTTYFSYDGNQSIDVIKCIVNQQENYCFEFPLEWEGQVTAESDRINRTLTFRLWNPGGGAQTGAPSRDFMIIKVFTASEWNENKANTKYDFLEYGPDESVVFAVHLENNKSISITMDEVKKAFKVI